MGRNWTTGIPVVDLSKRMGNFDGVEDLRFKDVWDGHRAQCERNIDRCLEDIRSMTTQLPSVICCGPRTK
jgi:hypothetical protein